MLKIGVYRPKGLPESFNVCIDNIIKFSDETQVQFIESADSSVLGRVDVVWDPRAGGGHAPARFLTELGRPLVVTLHGVGPLVFPEHYSVGLRHRWHVHNTNKEKKALWKELGSKCSRVITVSSFSKTAINEMLGIPLEKIDVVYNGVDSSVFNADEAKKTNAFRYFLHISNDESRKDVDRIIKAHKGIKRKDKWALVLKLSSKRESNDPQIRIINNRLSIKDIADLYRNASGFIFPSIYEGFGIPIIEAMASCCSVITTKDTACEEVASGYCRLVSPKDTSALKEAMESLMDAPDAPEMLAKAKEHALSFSWEAAARKYLAAFSKASVNYD